jgi:excisionase family DNA binding protein
MDQSHILEHPTPPAQDVSAPKTRAEGIDARGIPENGAVVTEAGNGQELGLSMTQALLDLTTIAQEIVGWLAQLARNVKRIANKLDPPPGEVVDTDTAADRLEPTRKGVSQKTGRGGSKWYSIEEAASLAGRSVSTIRRDIKAGTLPAHAIGRGRRRPSYRIRRADLKAYIQAGRAEQPDPPAVPTTPVRKKSRHFD